MTAADTMAAVLAAESARAAALVAGDWTALGGGLAPELHYVHATGLCHDRATLLAWLETDAPQFLSVTVQAPKVQTLAAGVALLTGTLAMALRRPSMAEPVLTRSWLSQIWLLGPDDRWRLRLLHSTRPA